jgi:hypothetical protein
MRYEVMPIFFEESNNFICQNKNKFNKKDNECDSLEVQN